MLRNQCRAQYSDFAINSRRTHKQINHPHPRLTSPPTTASSISRVLRTKSSKFSFQADLELEENRARSTGGFHPAEKRRRAWTALSILCPHSEFGDTSPFEGLCTASRRSVLFCHSPPITKQGVSCCIKSSNLKHAEKLEAPHPIPREAPTQSQLEAWNSILEFLWIWSLALGLFHGCGAIGPSPLSPSSPGNRSNSSLIRLRQGTS